MSDHYTLAQFLADPDAAIRRVAETRETTLISEYGIFIVELVPADDAAIRSQVLSQMAKDGELHAHPFESAYRVDSPGRASVRACGRVLGGRFCAEPADAPIHQVDKRRWWERWRR